MTKSPQYPQVTDTQIFTRISAISICTRSGPPSAAESINRRPRADENLMVIHETSPKCGRADENLMVIHEIAPKCGRADENLMVIHEIAPKCGRADENLMVIHEIAPKCGRADEDFDAGKAGISVTGEVGREEAVMGRAVEDVAADKFC